MLLQYFMSCTIGFSRTFMLGSGHVFAFIFREFISLFANITHGSLHAFSQNFCESTFSRIFGRLLNVWPSREFRSCSPVHISDILKRDNFTLPCGIPVFVKTRVQVSLICPGSG